MKKKIWLLTAILAICLLAVLPAMAADAFSFTDKSIILFEGEQAETALRREGSFTDGEVVYSTDSTKIATVAEDGTVTGVSQSPYRI